MFKTSHRSNSSSSTSYSNMTFMNIKEFKLNTIHHDLDKLAFLGSGSTVVKEVGTEHDA